MRKQILHAKVTQILDEYQHIDLVHPHQKFSDSDEWQHGYPEGGDSKFGTIMYSDKLKQWRRPNFEEFYGGSVVD